MSCFISEMIRDRAIVAMKCHQETVPRLSNGTIFNDLERPPNPDFKVTPLFDAEFLRNDTKCSYNDILMVTYTCPTQECHFE